jgi:quercetin dioxygenase-like cupin family protein
MLSMAMLGMLIVAPAVAQTPPVTVTTLFHSKANAGGQKITLPSGPVEVVVSEYVIAPGAKLPVHRHPFERYAFVESGTLRVTNTETGAANTYRTGDVIVEMINKWHSGENIGSDDVRLKVIDQLTPGKSSTIVKRGQ